MAELMGLEELKAKAKNGKLTDEERKRMMGLMDEELEEFMNNAEKKNDKRLDAWTEENWEEEMQKHPFFNQVISYFYLHFKL